MYNPSLYQVDTENRQEDYAVVLDGAVLFRIASLSHSDKNNIISGEGGTMKSSVGRYHQGQRVSYCANNVIICISELLYHMYRKVLDGIKDGQPTRHLSSWFKQEYNLAVFSVEEISDLVYVDSIGAKSYDPRILSSTVIFPDATYDPLHDISAKLRLEGKNGVVYPSARHSKDLAFAFFNNETSKIKGAFYETLLIKLQLILEDQDCSAFPPNTFKPHTDKLHATMGYYEFENPDHFNKLKDSKLIYPNDTPPRGYIDFVRRHYLNYPREAFRP